MLFGSAPNILMVFAAGEAAGLKLRSLRSLPTCSGGDAGF